MGNLDWEWRLPNGLVVRAQLELPSNVESVWLGEKLVSRSPAGGKPLGHDVQLSSSGSSYRSAPDARVVFDAFGGRLASCALMMDGHEIAPARAPRPVRSFALPAASGGGLLVLAIVAVRIVPSIFAPHRPAYVAPIPPVTDTTPEPGPPSTVPTATQPISDADRVIAGLRPAFRKCYEAGLGQDPTMGGRVVIDAQISTTGEVVTATATAKTGTLSQEVDDCIVAAVKKAQFTTTTGGRLHIPVSFVQKK